MLNTNLRRIFYVIVAGFMALIGTLSYWQVFAREAIAESPQNSLQTIRNQESPRGLILARDGETVLASSERQQDENGYAYTRVYPQGESFANIVGYYSIRFGKAGIEAILDEHLSGSNDPRTLRELVNRSTGGPQAGNNVELTLDAELQKIAYEGLSQTSTGRGSLVALDPETGEVLALASSPSYDPNRIGEGDYFQQLQQNDSFPLINRATQSLYAPGSTFKVITAAAGLQAGLTPSSEFFDSGEYQTPGYTVTNYKGESFGEVSFTEALVYSINAVFAEIGVEVVGAQSLADMAQEFGFGDSYEDFLLPVDASDLGPPASQWAQSETALASFGQGAVVSNAFEMALVAATIANDGQTMQPRILQEIRSPAGVLLESTSAEARRQVLSGQHARELQGMMRAVVSEGNLEQAKIEGVEVAGKTGTAEVGGGESPHSWWISFAPVDDPEIAVAAMVENGATIDAEGNADTPAIPIATEVTEAYLDGSSTNGRNG